MSATWSLGPDYNHFSRTSNSQYGAWTGSAGYGSSSSSSTQGGPFVPRPPAPRVSEVTAKDVAKIVSAADLMTSSTTEKFSDFMSKYGATGKIPVPPPKYNNEIVAMHSAAQAEKYGPHHHISSNSDFSLSMSRPSTSDYNSSVPKNSYMSSQKPVSDWYVKESEPVSDYSDMLKYPSESESSVSMKRTDQNNNMFHGTSNPTWSRPGLQRSNTFSGSSSSNSTTSRYPDARVAIDKLFSSDNKREQPRTPESRYMPAGFKSYGGSHGIKPEGDISVTRPAAARDYLSRESTSRDSKSSIYWLYGTQGRPTTDTSSIPRSVAPYKPGDYMLASDPEYKIASAAALETIRREQSAAALDKLRREHGSIEPETSFVPYPYEVRNRFESSARPSTPYTSTPYTDDSYHTGSTYDTFQESAPEFISRPVSHHRPILKKGQSRSGSSYSSGSDYKGYEAPSYRGMAQINKQLPPLASGTLRRGGSKRVTFNLAMNKTKAFID